MPVHLVVPISSLKGFVRTYVEDEESLDIQGVLWDMQHCHDGVCVSALCHAAPFFGIRWKCGSSSRTLVPDLRRRQSLPSHQKF